MAYLTGKLFFILLVAVLLSSIASWMIAGWYRKAMQQLDTRAGGDRYPTAHGSAASGCCFYATGHGLT